VRASAIVQVYEAASLVCDIIGKGDHALKAARSLRRIMRTISLVALILVWMAGMGHTAPIVTVSSWSLRYVEPLVEAFNAKGLGIEAEAVQLRPDALKARLITNLAPDIIMYTVGDFDYEWEHYWLDLTEVVKRLGSRGDWLPGTWDALTIPAGPYKGEIRRIKNTYEVPVLYYDKDQMANAGVMEPADMHRAGRWSWEDMLSLAKKLTRDLNGDGLTDVWGLAHDISHGWKSSGYYEIWGLQAGEYFVSPDGYYRGNQPAFVDMVQWWADLYNVHHVMQSPRPGVSTLPSGLSAMIMYGTHLHASADWREFRTWDMAPLPNLPQNKAYNYMFEHGAWVVNKNCADIDATMKFVEFLLSPEAVQIMSREVGFFPVRLSVAREFANYQQERYPWAKNVAYTIISMVEGTMLPTKPGPWYMPNWNDVRDHMHAAVRSVLAGEVPAAVALEQVAGPIESILAAGRKDMIAGTLWKW